MSKWWQRERERCACRFSVTFLRSNCDPECVRATYKVLLMLNNMYLRALRFSEEKKKMRCTLVFPR